MDGAATQPRSPSTFRFGQRFALAAAGEKTVREQYKLEARKILVNRTDFQSCAAQFVGRRLLSVTLTEASYATNDCRLNTW